MFRISLFVAPALIVAMAVSAWAKGDKVNHALRGKVESVSGGSVVLSVKAGKKKGGAVSQKTVQVDGNTTFEFVKVKKHAKGEKVEPEISPASMSDLKAGETVQVVLGDTAATKVSIMQGHHGKKKGKSQ